MAEIIYTGKNAATQNGGALSADRKFRKIATKQRCLTVLMGWNLRYPSPVPRPNSNYGGEEMLEYGFIVLRDRPVGFIFDRIRINTTYPLDVLKKRLPVSKIKNEAYYFQVRVPSEAAQCAGFKSTINIVCPSSAALNLLDIHLDPSTAIISYIEITSDVMYESKQETVEEFKHHWNLRKKYTHKHFTYNVYDDDRRNRRKFDDDATLFYHQTAYFGGRNFQYVIYPRLSKINGLPVFHGEWRIEGAASIWEKTGIRSISDLLTFDFEKFFDDMDRRYIAHERIDKMKLGRWLKGWTRKKKLTPLQLMAVQLIGSQFMNHKQIHCYADLVAYFMKEKERIKNKPGARSKRDRRILAIRDYGMFRKVDPSVAP